MICETTSNARFHVIRLDPGEDVLLALREWVSAHSITNASFVSGVGSLTRYHAHVVETTNLPPGNIFFKGEGAYDILTLTGFVIDGKVHAHIGWSDDKVAMGGHLEEGCTVLTFAIVTAVELGDVDISNWDESGRRFSTT
jgi:predicted DNA-binding protein with PD1-like motif